MAIHPNTLTLRALSATASLGSFSAAAEHLGVTQGAIAQQVRQFEAQLGFKLFERWARGLKPTQVCKSYLAEIEPALERIQDATTQLSAGQDVNPNQVVVSTTPSIASRWLIPRLSEFYVNHADIVVAIDATETLRRFTGPNAIDVALRWGGTPNKEQYSRSILSNRLIAVANPKLTDGKNPSVQLLEDKPLINDSHKFWDSWSAHFNIPLPSKPLAFGHTNYAIDAAINGLGIALVPKVLISEPIRRGDLVEVLPPNRCFETDVKFHLVSRNDEQSEAVRTVIQWMLDQTKI